MGDPVAFAFGAFVVEPAHHRSSHVGAFWWQVCNPSLGDRFSINSTPAFFYFERQGPRALGPKSHGERTCHHEHSSRPSSSNVTRLCRRKCTVECSHTRCTLFASSLQCGRRQNGGTHDQRLRNTQLSNDSHQHNGHACSYCRAQ